MRYLLVVIENERYWFEINDADCVIRQIILDASEEYHLSCFEDCLAEEKICVSELEGNVMELSKNEFDDIWRLLIKPHENQWKEIKKKYLQGDCVVGVCSCIYPQGIILKGRDFIAIYIGNKNCQIGQKIQVQIDKYDDDNMWLICV